MIRKVIIHIDDEWFDWESLALQLEKSIKIGLSDEEFAAFDVVRPTNNEKNSSPTFNDIKWTKNENSYHLTWVANGSASIDQKVVERLDLSSIPKKDMFFVVDGLRPKKNGKSGSVPSLEASFADITPYIEDTKKQVRIFTAYKEQLLKGVHVVKLPIVNKGVITESVNLTGVPELLISKTENSTIGTSEMQTLDILTHILNFVYLGN